MSTFINQGGAVLTGVSITVNKPTNTADGDIMFAFMCSSKRYATSTPAGWTLLGQNHPIAGYYELFYKIASGEGANYAWGYAGTDSRLDGMILTYRGGFDTSDPIDVVSNTGYFLPLNTTLRAASMNVAEVNESLFFFGGNYQGSTGWSFLTNPTVPTAWQEDQKHSGGAALFGTLCCSMVWAGSGATGNMDAVLSEATTTKQAFAVALNPIPPRAFFPVPSHKNV